MIITFANFKGGVGKTTSTALFAYLLSKSGKKVLAVDTDPQSNLTESLTLTFKDKIDNEKNIFSSLFADDSLKNYIHSLDDNLDILAGSWDMVNFDLEAGNHYYKEDFKEIIKFRLASVKEEYDYILIDTAPTTSIVMDNVIRATDQVIITTKTEPLAYESTQKYYEYLLKRYNENGYKFELLGVLPYLVGKSATDRDILAVYKNIFEDELFENTIKSSDRVKTWSNKGITEDEPYDKVTMEMYQKSVNEALNRLKIRASN